MTAKTTKTTKPADDATVATEAIETATATSATKAARGGFNGRTAKAPAKAPKPRQRTAVGDTEATAERTPRTDTKQAKLIEMLKAKDGTTVEEIASAFGWQNHTGRGALYGALKKKLGLDIVSEKVEGRGRVYRIGS